VQPPYDQLYIYYIKGRIREDSALSSSSFIGNWEEEGDSFLFYKEPADALVEKAIKSQSHLVLADRFNMSYEAWQGDRIAPLSVGRIFVKPPWDKTPPPPDKLSLFLDPGVVFGNGQHSTTKDCLEAMQLAFKHQAITRVADLGTGTGLLAMAATVLGAERVLAVDLNKLATQTARQNVNLNAMADRILVVQGDAKNFMDVNCDLMVSNIHYAVMRLMIKEPGFRAYKQFVLSGLLRSQTHEIERLLNCQAARIIRKWDQDGTWFSYWGCNTRSSC
jgi:ribosomal protein L11 methyltransferase